MVNPRQYSTLVCVTSGGVIYKSYVNLLDTYSYSYGILHCTHVVYNKLLTGLFLKSPGGSIPAFAVLYTPEENYNFVRN
jgi:hypothetical protein